MSGIPRKGKEPEALHLLARGPKTGLSTAQRVVRSAIPTDTRVIVGRFYDLKHYIKRVSNNPSGRNGRTKHGNRKRVNAPSIVDVANVNMTTREERDSVTDAYRNGFPKGKTISLAPGMITGFDLPP